jgi:regulatory factor X, other
LVSTLLSGNGIANLGRLRESCVRSSSSVRRDRVFSRYTERCGSERVPTLNPASFGKLVRIIFPNVQTRRLGVRGESKYHYVDLSLVANDDEDRLFASNQSLTRPSTAGGINQDADSIAEGKSFPSKAANNDARPASRHSMETADFPVPSTTLPLQPNQTTTLESQPSAQNIYRLDCQYHNTATIRIPTRGQTNNLVAALPAVRPNLPGSVATYLAMPSPHLVSQQEASDSPVELPDIAPYLAGVEHDADIAKSLYHLYRSYCTDVIDSFRKCREKNFFNHHSAFNGKMTVPVSKLFNLDCLAPWIQECDMRMYKQIAKFTAPLVLQNVPDMVWGVFDRIAIKLVHHIINSFEEKCPVHVVVAKAVPAARFTNLLKKLRPANTATLQMSRLLDDPNTRTQMWLDLLVMVNPETVLDDSAPPPECFSNVQGVLKHDLRTLLEPMQGGLVTTAEEDPTSLYVNFLNEPTMELPGVLSLDVLDQPMALLDKWISWLQCLPETFQGHHPQCMLDWHRKFWRSILADVGNNGANSFQAWWYAETFTTALLSWMAEMQGLLMSEAEQKRVDAYEMEKMQQCLTLSSSTNLGKRKREADTEIGMRRTAKRTNSDPLPAHITTRISSVNKGSVAEPLSASLEPTLPELPQVVDADDTDAEMDELRRGGPLHLPSIGLGFHTGLTSPLKMSKTPLRAGMGGVNDDSGIDLGLDIDIEAEKEAKKFRKADWLVSLSSDPVEGSGLGASLVV